MLESYTNHGKVLGMSSRFQTVSSNITLLKSSVAFVSNLMLLASAHEKNDV